MGYHAVFVLAIGLIVLDICLRLVMVEPKNAAQWIQSSSDGETQGLLNEEGAHSAGYNAITANASAGQTSGIADECPTEGSGEPLTSGRSTSVPGIVRLIFSGKLLVVLLATVVDAIIWSAFDTVCAHPIFSKMKLTRSGAPTVCHENVRLGIIRNWAVFPTALCAFFPLPMDWYVSDDLYALWLC